jgi:hypothetical protein
MESYWVVFSYGECTTMSHECGLSCKATLEEAVEFAKSIEAKDAYAAVYIIKGSEVEWS